MTRTIWKLVAAGALVVAVIVGGSVYCGVKFESRFREAVTELSKRTPYSLTLVSYQRGLLGATAETQLDIPNPAAAAQKPGGTSNDTTAAPLHVILHHQISHGPRLDGLRFARLVTTPEFAESVREWLAKLFKDDSAVTLTVDFGFDGAVDGHLASPVAATVAAAIVPADNAAAAESDTQVGWAGLDGRFHLARDGNTLTYNLLAPRLSVQFDGHKFTIDKIGATGNQSRGAVSKTWLGESALIVDSVNVSLDTLSFSVEKVAVKSLANEENGLVKSTVTLSAARVSGGSETVEQPTLRMSISNIDAAALDEWSERARALTPDPTADVQKQLARMLAEMKPVAAKLAARRPLFAIEDLSFRTATGSAKLSGEIQYVGSGATDSFSPQTDLEAKLAVELPAALFDELAAQKTKIDLRKPPAGNAVDAKQLDEQAHAAAAAMRQSFVDQRLLKVDGERLTSNVEFRGGALTVNGEPFPSAVSVH